MKLIKTTDYDLKAFLQREKIGVREFAEKTGKFTSYIYDLLHNKKAIKEETFKDLIEKYNRKKNN